MSRRSLSVLGAAAAAAIAGAAIAASAALKYDGTRTAKAEPPPPTVPDSASCRPPEEHPNPVVLVHGTFAATSWEAIAPALARRGYCVFTFAYGQFGTADIAGSARELSAYVNRLLRRTGAKRVSIVGHSEGGMMPRYYIKYLGGASKVEDLVGLAPSNHGTENLLALVGEAFGCTACGQQQANWSALLESLNRGHETPPPVDYTVVQTRFDTVVVPFSSAFLNGPDERVTNVVLQDDCPDDDVDHVGITVDPVAVQWVQDALSHEGPADPGFRPSC
jgi:triacylglycerol lipase